MKLEIGENLKDLLCILALLGFIGVVAVTLIMNLLCVGC